MAKKRDSGKRIIESLNQLINWTKGKEKVYVTFAGKK